jgi:hypothetical protein
VSTLACRFISIRLPLVIASRDEWVGGPPGRDGGIIS